MHVHIDPETLKRYPWLGVLIGMAGCILMVFVTVGSFKEYLSLRTVPAPTPITAATASLSPGERSKWVVLNDGVWHHDLLIREERRAPECWIFGRVDNTQVPVTDGKGKMLIIIKHDGNVESRALEEHPLTGMLIREHDNVWGGAVSHYIRIGHTEPLLVLVPGAGPRQAFLYTFGGLGFLLVFSIFSSCYLVLWFRQRRSLKPKTMCKGGGREICQKG